MDKPFACRLEFIEGCAGRGFSEDMDRKVTGANQRISHVLWCAAVDRAEWYFNNQRFSHTLSHGLSLTGQAATISQTNSRLLLARLTAKSVWSEEEWQRWCSSCAESDKVQKAWLAASA